MLIIFCLLLAIRCGFLGQTSSLSRHILQVHLIPHSHDDVGWLQTYQHYYSKQYGVRDIINSYVAALERNTRRKFMQVEIAFFKLWWDEANLFEKQRIRALVQSGQLEFVNGGWVMNDEATAYFEDIIDQMTLGHTFLQEQLGITPTVGWQIDPFGHSSTQNMLYTMMGYQSLFISRIHYQDKFKRSIDNNLEFYWNTNNCQYPLFTHVTFQHYSSPKGFDFDRTRRTIPINPNNIANRSQSFVNYFKNQTKYYQGDVIAHLIGDDFEWSLAEIYFQNIDQLIDYINERPDEFKMHIQYSTPNEYTKALKQHELNYSQKHDDFFPYADDIHAYWSGYFTSRPNFKGFVRDSGRLAQYYKMFLSILIANNRYNQLGIEVLQQLNEAMAICQHHDAISGTARKPVMKDYSDILSKAVHNTEQIIFSIMSGLIQNSMGQTINNFIRCNFNETAKQCDIYQPLIDGNKVLLMLLQTQSQSQFIRIKVPKLNLTILDEQHNKVVGDVLCSNKTNNNDCQLIFKSIINNTYYQISKSKKQGSAMIINGSNINTISNRVNIGDIGFNIDYLVYYSYQYIYQKSGAYIFRPTDYAHKYNNIQTIIQYTGLIIQAQSMYGDKIDSLIISYNETPNQATIDSYVYSIDASNIRGKEIVMRINTDIDNDSIFYTSTNGLDLEQRILNYQDTYDANFKEPISSNYYPCNGILLINDTINTVAIVNDRSQGCTSLGSGQLEFMINRRILLDDSRGLDQPLDDFIMSNPPPNDNKYYKLPTAPVSMTHNIVFYQQQSNIDAARIIQFNQNNAPIVIFGISNTTKFKMPMIPPCTQLWNVFEDIQFMDEYNNTSQLGRLYVQPQRQNKQYLIRILNMHESVKISVIWPQNLVYHESSITGTTPINNNIQSYIYPQQIRTFIVHIVD